MENQLKIHVKNVYGRELLYPQCKQSMLITDLLNVKTLSHFHIVKLKQLGYEIKSDCIELEKMFKQL